MSKTAQNIRSRRAGLSRPVVLILAAIVLLAAIPRVLDLGTQPIWIDEDLTWIATNAILEDGLPRMPSGTFYPRAPFYSYVAAGALWVGQGSIAALRVPSVVFSLATIVAVFFLGRAVASTTVGLVAALVLALSPWDVHYARMARMYELLSVLFVLTVLFAHRGLVRGERSGRILMLLTAFLAVFAHRQGATLASVFVIPFLLPREKRPPVGWMFAGLVTVMVSLRCMDWFAAYGFDGGSGLDSVPRREDTGIIPFPVLGAIDLNHARALLFEALDRSRLVGGAAIALVAGVGAFVTGALVRERRLPAAGVAALFAGALLVNQLTLAAALSLVVIKLGSRSVSEGIRRSLSLALAAGAAVGITFAAVALTMGTEALSDRFVLRSLVAVPVPWFKLLFAQYPFMTGIVAAGIFVHVLRSLREGADQSLFFLSAVFLIPLIGMGIMPSPYFGYRYNFYLHAVHIVLFVATVVPVVSFLTAAIAERRRRVALAATMTGVVLALFCDAFDPVEAFGVRNRVFGGNKDRFRHPDLTASYNYDFPSTVEYVRAHREPGDIVIARDPVNLYPYLGSADYLVSAPYDGRSLTPDGELVDWYLGIPYIENGRDLVAVLNRHVAKGRWIIYTRPDGEAPHAPASNLTASQLAVLEALDAEHRVHTGRDGTTVVVYIPAGRSVAVGDLPADADGTETSTQDGTSRNRLRISGVGTKQVSVRPNHRYRFRATTSYTASRMGRGTITKT